MAPAPLTKSNEIIEFLATFTSRSSSNCFSLRASKKDALVLCGSTPTQGFIILGAIACLEHDIPSMHKFHQQSLETSNKSAHALTNYAISLRKCGLWAEALSYYEEAVESTPPDEEVFASMCFLNNILGNYEKSKDLPSIWKKLNQKFDDSVPYDKVFEFLKETSLNQADIKLVMTTVGKALCKTEAIVKNYDFCIIKNDENLFLNYELTIADPDADLIELENHVDDHLAQADIPDHFWNHFTITFHNPELGQMLDCFDKSMSDGTDVLVIPDEAQMRMIEDLIKGVKLD